MTGVILQVRLDSSRMPGKALLVIGRRTVFEHVMHRLRRIRASAYIAACDESSAEILGPLAARAGFTLVPGPKEDVLSRYLLAAGRSGIDTIIRATGDNPLVSAEYANSSLDAHLRDGADHTIVTGLPIGCGVEVVERKALERAARESGDAYDHEHVTPYLYGHPEMFRLQRIPADLPGSLAASRVTLDTPDDYRQLLRIYRELAQEGELPEFSSLCGWLLSRPRTGESSQ